MRYRSRLPYLVVTFCCVLFTMGMAVLQRRLLTEVFPRQEPTFEWDDTEWRRNRRQLTIQLFGVDPKGGQAVVLRQFGRPSKALYFAPTPSPWGGVVEACVYIYPTFEIRFINKMFATLDIHGKDDRFPIGGLPLEISRSTC